MVTVEMLLMLLIIVMVIGDLANFDAQDNGNPSSSPAHTDITSNTGHCVSVENMDSTT